VIVIFIPPLVTRAEDVARAIRTVAERAPADLPLITVFMQAQGLPPELRGIPSYRFPEDAARALARVTRYGEWRATPPGAAVELDDVRREEAAAVIASALGSGDGWLGPDAVARLLDCYGIPMAEWRTARTAEDAGAAAAELDGPVALKAIAPTLLHKTEAGAVRLGLAGPGEVVVAAERMREAVEGGGHPLEGFLVQRMVPDGIEMLVGVVHDPVFGPVVACGAGGTAVELLKDVSVRLTPLTDRDADEMLRDLRTYPLLEGFRGAPGGDIEAIRDVLLRVAALVEDHPSIAEMDLNPVMVLQPGAAVVDARVRVETPPPPEPLSARRRATT
jgi:acyl-CoA synthetase (NDP forming)